MLLTAGVAHAESETTAVIGWDSCGKFIAALGDAPLGKFRGINTAKGVFVSEHMRQWTE